MRHPHAEEWVLISTSYPAPINSKWIKDLSGTPETEKLLEEDRENHFKLQSLGRQVWKGAQGSTNKSKNWRTRLHKINKKLHRKQV